MKESANHVGFGKVVNVGPSEVYPTSMIVFILNVGSS